MALVFVGGKAVGIDGSTSDTNISLTDLTGGLASAPAAGDLVIVAYVVASGAGGDIALGVTTSGYTEVVEPYADDDYNANFSVSYKVMGGTPDSSVDVSPTLSAFLGGAVAIHVWRGVDASTPLDVSAQSATGINGGQPNPPAITPTTAGSVVVACGGAACGSGANFTSSDLSNFYTTFGNASLDGVVGIGSASWTSGALNPAAWGGGGSGNNSDSWAAVTLALRPGPNTIEGALSKTLGALTSSSASKLALSATLSKTLGALTASSAANLPLAGAATVALGQLTAVSAGTLPITGAANITLNALVASATGEVTGSGLNVTLDPLTCTATGVLPITGALDVELGALTAGADAALALQATTSVALSSLTATATAKLGLVGSFVKSLGALTAVITGEFNPVAASGNYLKHIYFNWLDERYPIRWPQPGDGA